jgi:hypothetical protein
MKVLYRLLAAANIGLAIFGVYEMLYPLSAVRNGFRPGSWSPWVVPAFWTMMMANIVFFTLFCAGLAPIISAHVSVVTPVTTEQRPPGHPTFSARYLLLRYAAEGAARTGPRKPLFRFELVHR